MAVPTQISDQSAGSTPLNGTAGSLYDIFKRDLPNIGWTLEYDDASGQRAAFRNNPVSGTGYYLMIWDDPADHDGDARVAKIQIYLDMSDIDTGIDPVYSVERYIAKSPTLDSDPQEWHLIGDSQRFYFMRQAGGDGFNCYTFGDGKNYFAGDNRLFVCPLSDSATTTGQSATWGISEISYTTSTLSSGQGSNLPEAFARNYANTGPAAARFRSFPPNSTIEAIPGSTGTTLDTSRPAARIIVAEGYSPRGELVGILNPLESRPYGNGFQLLEGVVHNGNEVTDVIYFNMTPFGGEATPNRGSIYIDVGSDWSNW